MLACLTDSTADRCLELQLDGRHKVLGSFTYPVSVDPPKSRQKRVPATPPNTPQVRTQQPEVKPAFLTRSVSVESLTVPLEQYGADAERTRNQLLLLGTIVESATDCGDFTRIAMRNGVKYLASCVALDLTKYGSAQACTALSHAARARASQCEQRVVQAAPTLVQSPDFEPPEARDARVRDLLARNHSLRVQCDLAAARVRELELQLGIEVVSAQADAVFPWELGMPPVQAMPCPPAAAPFALPDISMEELDAHLQDLIGPESTFLDEPIGEAEACEVWQTRQLGALQEITNAL